MVKVVVVGTEDTMNAPFAAVLPLAPLTVTYWPMERSCTLAVVMVMGVTPMPDIAVMGKEAR